jgi:hypothetical protein
MEWEVAEDFRIVNAPEDEEEKTTVESLLDDLMEACE